MTKKTDRQEAAARLLTVLREAAASRNLPTVKALRSLTGGAKNVFQTAREDLVKAGLIKFIRGADHRVISITVDGVTLTPTRAPRKLTAPKIHADLDGPPIPPDEKDRIARGQRESQTARWLARCDAAGLVYEDAPQALRREIRMVQVQAPGRERGAAAC